MNNLNHTALRKALKVYFIMGTQNCIKNPYEVLVDAIAGGITCFQFREKGQGSLSGKEKYALAEELQLVCQNAHIPFIVNDDIDLALALNADGVHIGQEDESVQSVRERIGNKILGVSIHTLEEASIAIKAGATILVLAQFFQHIQKRMPRPFKELRLFRNFVRKE